MPPNCTAEKIPSTECAAPFKDEPSGSRVAKPNLVQNGNPSAFVSLRREDSRDTETNLRVNTLCQYTYELDKYRKNAMLIFQYDDVYHGCRQTANKVRRTFEKFRFEVEVHHNATGDEVKALSAAFFQRDFDEYGALGIIVMGKTNSDGYFITPGSTFMDMDILRHMSTANLRSKPKIIIFECDQIPRRYFTRAYADSDVIDYNFPAVVCTFTEYNITYNPLSYFCDKMDRLADRTSLDVILYNVVLEAKLRDWKWPPSYLDGTLLIDKRPFFSRAYVNLSKQLILWRNP